MESLPDDCLTVALSYLEKRQLILCGHLSRRFRNVINHPNLWRKVVIDGDIETATAFICNALLSRNRASFIRTLTVKNIVVPPEASPSTPEVFSNSVNRLITSSGNRLIEFHMEDITIHPRGLQKVLAVPPTHYPLFADHDIISGVATYCPNLKEISFAGSEEADYIGDDMVLMLTNSCPFVERFSDKEAFGLTPQAILHVVDGWKCLKTLELNTECMDITTFASTISLFGSRLTTMGVTHFQDPLSTNLETLFEALSKLTNLQALSFDFEMTPHQDALTSTQVEMLVEVCPTLKRLNVSVPIEGYLDVGYEVWEEFMRWSEAELKKYDENLGGGRWREKVECLPPLRKGGDEGDLAPRQSLQLYGVWTSGDKVTIRKRAFEHLQTSTLSFQTLPPTVDIFLTILEELGRTCQREKLEATIAWSI
ncbi:hypothetical protein HDV05_003384 [Chytridiales sp. JEL 0842]|nr:hypothetical protein HDV05_003384 [Chytridiales sp. JEL 0842]